MNELLTKTAREYLKENLPILPDASQLLFKRMYSHKNLTLSIGEVVDDMPEEKLDWAMQQVKSTLEKY